MIWGKSEKPVGHGDRITSVHSKVQAQVEAFQKARQEIVVAVEDLKGTVSAIDHEIDALSALRVDATAKVKTYEELASHYEKLTLK